ncbi:MAG: DUF58 domain-containing protein, partial [Anaerolineales bacterium]|nr:DUF58 domain-containing protein [Anaerolineales bacterium]
QRALRYAAMQVGEELEEDLRLQNTAPLPALWAEVQDDSDLPGYTVASVRSVDGGGRLQWRAHAVCTRRGLFSLGRWTLRLGDPFGLFLVEQHYEAPQTLVVYPSLAALPRALLPHTPTLGEQRLLRQPLPAETVNAVTTRPHVPGDPLRHMHWRTTARRGAPFTKIFEPEATHRVWLIVDFDPAAHGGPPDDPTEELLVLLAASLAARLLQQRLAVGLLAAHGAETVLVPPRPGLAHVWDHLRALAPLHPAAATPPLAELLTRAQSVLSGRDLLIVVTPSLAPAWPVALMRTAQRGVRAEVILIDPASFGLAGSAEAFRPALANLGVPARLVRRGEVQPLSAVYGTLRRWEFMTLGTGRAVAMQTPRGAPSLEAQLASLQAQSR